VPFVIKAGKALDERKVEVRIRFNAVAGAVKSVSRCAPNELIVRVQPDESIYWKVQSKAPGLDFHIEQQRMDLMYNKDRKREMPEAYERLILEVLRGDATNFVSAAELEAAWKIFTPALKHLMTQNRRPEPYKVGSRGPAAADRLATRIQLKKFGSQRDERRVSMGNLAAMHNSESFAEGPRRGTEDLEGLEHIIDHESER
jgi:glucose-6-phosphate 1-dehydrogenase